MIVACLTKISVIGVAYGAFRYVFMKNKFVVMIELS